MCTCKLTIIIIQNFNFTSHIVQDFCSNFCGHFLKYHTEIMQEYTEICKSILECERVYWNMQAYTGMCKECTRVYWNVQGYTET